MASEDILFGLVASILCPVIGLRIARGLRDGRLPLYRTYVDRSEGAGRFNALLVLHCLSLLLMAVIAADLLFGLHLRSFL